MLIEIITGNTYNISSILFPHLHFWASKIIDDARKNCRELVPAMQANITILPDETWRVSSRTWAWLSSSLNTLHSYRACSLWVSFWLSRGWEGEEILGKTNAYLQTRLSTSDRKREKNLEILLKNPDFWTLEKLENEARLACLLAWQ